MTYFPQLIECFFCKKDVEAPTAIIAKVSIVAGDRAYDCCRPCAIKHLVESGKTEDEAKAMIDQIPNEV